MSAESLWNIDQQHMDKPIEQEMIDYFRSNIHEALSSYCGWKMLSHSKSSGVVTQRMAERYVEVQKYHPQFFGITERAFLVHFVITILHPFDRDDHAYSLYKIDREATQKFINENESVLEALRKLRNQLFAHRDSRIESFSDFVIPSVINLDQFFKNLMGFYNQLTSRIDNSGTRFSNALDVMRDIEILFMNLYRGETVRKKEIEIEWDWEKDDKKASDLLAGPEN